MYLNNNVTEFILLGLTQDPVRKKVVFVIFLLFYLGTLVGNLLILTTIKTSHSLGSPMYFFLFYLSLSDTCFSTSIAPKTIVDSFLKKTTISFIECIIQVFTFHFFGCLEIFILILMAVDRYVAICKPLHYTAIMSRQVCNRLVAMAWVGSCVHSLTQIFLALSLPFCGPNVIDHYFCDLHASQQLTRGKSQGKSTQESTVLLQEEMTYVRKLQDFANTCKCKLGEYLTVEVDLVVN
ncbi:olfactory receptor 4C16-like [Tupaia chinensis]|uniref:olfactory receptor 4C16-like n=1 Tax=Tupaia chinensis TaxID=246437 RepID=UPI0003C9094A|nr:olfactory receptor 4C16-like [Tupaia chinensis]